MPVSSLCSYQNLTSKCSARTGGITRITPHQMAAGWTGRQCADYFCSTSRECSANYCIGMDGDIAQNVDEACRAWTSSSWENDNQAITVEIANSHTGTDEMTDASIEAFIELCVDLMRRYPSIGSQLEYTGDASGNLTLHEMFASTNCPGSYFKGKIDYIVGEVNRRLAGGDEEEDMKLNWFRISSNGAQYLYADGRFQHINDPEDLNVLMHIYAEMMGGNDIPNIDADDHWVEVASRYFPASTSANEVTVTGVDRAEIEAAMRAVINGAGVTFSA